MTDLVSQLLRDAGERWRAAQPEPPALRPIRPRSWGVLAAAAAAVVAIAGGALYLANQMPGPTDSTASPTSGPLVVTDGTEVEASGVVRQAGGEIRFCAPAVTTAIDANGCPHYVVVEGVELSKLVDGKAHLRGVWRSGTLTVTWQGPPLPPTNTTYPESVRTSPSLPNAQQISEEASKVLRPLMEDRANGVYGSGMPGWQYIAVDVVVLTPQLQEKISAIKGAPVEIRPWLRPVR